MTRLVHRDSVDRFLTGRGTYLQDILVPGLKHAVFVRSESPHARILKIDDLRARALPGVRAILTANDLIGKVGSVMHRMPTPPFQPLHWPLLAVGKVRYVGDPVAVVVADDPYIAQDGADLLRVTYAELPVAANVSAAIAPGAPLLYEEWGTNVFAHLAFQHGDVQGRLASAAGILEERFVHHRICGFPMEGHGVCAFREASGRLVVHASTQFPHQLQASIADLTGMALSDIRVVAPDIGGGFGLKQHVTREELLVAVLPCLLPYPIRWTRGIDGTLENGIHAREQYHEVQAAYDRDGKVTALHLQVLADVGDPTLYFTGAGPAIVTASSLTGAYDIEAYSYDIQAIATNTAPVGGYRGFGQPQALFTMERTLDLIAHRLGLDPVAIRRVNLIPDQPRPFVTATGCVYDTGSIRAQFDRLLEATSDQAVRAESTTASGALVGVGYACYIEPNAADLHSFAGRYGAFEVTTLAIQPDGGIVACVGTKDIGQGSSAALRRIVADEFATNPEAVSVRDGDTDLLPLGLGTLASRALVMTGGALRDAARQLRAKLAAIAAHHLGVPIESVTFRAGGCRSGDKAVSLAELAAIAYITPYDLPPDVDPGLSAVGVYHARHADSLPRSDGRMNPAATYSSQVATARVRVDPASGEVDVTDFTVIFDCGTVINHLAVEGQIQGSFAQGLSAVLFEDLRYQDARPTRITDYRVARMADVPSVRAVEMSTPSDLPGGARGVGQIATILAPAAIANAIDDALHPLGITIRQTNLGASELRRLIAETQAPLDLVAGADRLGNATTRLPTR